MTRLRLHVLDLGRMRMHATVLIGSAASPFGETVDVPISAYCIDHPDGRVLFDTGCHPRAMGENGRWTAAFQQKYPHFGGEACSLPARLEQLGLGCDDFRYVVLSHLHSDYAGCVEFFRKSQLIVHEAEFDAAQRARLSRDEAYASRDVDAWVAADLHWRKIASAKGDLDIHAEIRLLNFGLGHAAGMLGLSVSLPETGRIILASDALYCAENFNDAVLPGWLEDESGYRKTVAKIRQLAGGAQVWFGHDPRQFANLRTSERGWYE